MAFVIRLDRVGLLASNSDQVTGPRLFKGVVARTHTPTDPLVYVDGPEYRDDSELQRIAAQLTNIRVVSYAPPSPTNPLSHPDGLLADGADYYEIGIVTGGRVVADQVVADIYISDEGALKEIEDGTTQLSLGYRCVLDAGRYQRNIYLDHLSVVGRARCGSACSLKMDSKLDCGCKNVANVPVDATNLPVKVEPINVPMTITLDAASQKIVDVIGSLTPEQLAAMAKAVAPKADGLTVEIEISEESDECTECGADLPDGATTCPECGASCSMDRKACDACAKMKDGGKCDACKAKKSDAASSKKPCPCTAKNMPYNGATMDSAELQTKLDAALAEIATLKSGTAKIDEAGKLALDQALANLKVETARADKLVTELDEVKTCAMAKVDAAQAARTDAEEKEFAKRVDARVTLLADAAKIGIEDFKTKTDREIKVAIVKKVDEMDIGDDMSPDYVDGMYAGAVGRHERAAASVAEVRSTIQENRDGAVAATDPYKAEAEIREAAEAKRKNRWR